MKNRKSMLIVTAIIIMSILAGLLITSCDISNKDENDLKSSNTQADTKPSITEPTVNNGTETTPINSQEETKVDNEPIAETTTLGGVSNEDKTGLVQQETQAVSRYEFRPSASTVLDHTKSDVSQGHILNMPIRGFAFSEDKTASIEGTEILVMYKFDISGLSGDVVKTTLKIYNLKNRQEPPNGTTSIFAVPDNSWDQSTVTWNTKPECNEKLGSYENTEANVWTEVELSEFVSGDGTYSFMFKSDAGYAYILPNINYPDAANYLPILEIETKQ